MWITENGFLYLVFDKKLFILFEINGFSYQLKFFFCSCLFLWQHEWYRFLESNRLLRCWRHRPIRLWTISWRSCWFYPLALWWCWLVQIGGLIRPLPPIMDSGCLSVPLWRSRCIYVNFSAGFGPPNIGAEGSNIRLYLKESGHQQFINRITIGSTSGYIQLAVADYNIFALVPNFVQGGTFSCLKTTGWKDVVTQMFFN